MQQVQGTESHVSQKKTHESGHLHLQPLSWSILSWVKVQTGWGYCRCTLSYLIISQIKPSDIHPSLNWASSNTENKSFSLVCTGTYHRKRMTVSALISEMLNKMLMKDDLAGNKQLTSSAGHSGGFYLFFTNKKLSYIIAPLFHWSLIFSLNCLNDEKSFAVEGPFAFACIDNSAPKGHMHRNCNNFDTDTQWTKHLNTTHTITCYANVYLSCSTSRPIISCNRQNIGHFIIVRSQSIWILFGAGRSQYFYFFIVGTGHKGQICNDSLQSVVVFISSSPPILNIWIMFRG